ncbi:hypothetical protein LZ31DRAFT_550298 [Colletotrichum somersetense]|nr:hypothetical protein LZ31DRAFT_550298 [Colletotrichum somersetense]
MRLTSPLLARFRTVYLLTCLPADLLKVPTIFTHHHHHRHHHHHHHLEPRRLSQDASQGPVPPNSFPDLDWAMSK